MRSKDRLAELRQLASSASVGVYHDTVELVKEPLQHDVELHQIFQEVERIHGWLHQLDNNTQLIQRLHADPTFHTNKQLQDQLESAVTSSNATGLKVCGALRQLGERARSTITSTTSSEVVAARITRLHHAALTSRYSEVLARHHAALNVVHQHHVTLLHEQIKLTQLEITEEECQSLLDSNNLSLFVDNLRAETAQARLQLREAEARHSELRRVEASLAEVHGLFQQVALLVASQQDQLDSVQYFALQASDHVGSGGDHLLKGTVTRTKARKKKLGLMMCLAVGAAVVLLVLIVT